MEEKGIDVKEMRMRLNITQEEFANRLGVGIRTVQKWEAGGKIPKTKHQIIRTIANQADTNGGKQQAADTPNVKELRQRLNMTQQALANELGVSVVTIQNYERGKTIPGTMRRKLESMTAGLVTTSIAQTVTSNNAHRGGKLAQPS